MAQPTCHEPAIWKADLPAKSCEYTFQGPLGFSVWEFVRKIEPEPTAAPSAPSCEKRIGLVLSHAGDQLNMELLLGVEQAAKARGYEVSFTYSEENGELQAQDVARMQANGVCGFIIFPLSDEEEDQAIAHLCAQGTPLVLIDRYLPKLPTDYVGVDHHRTHLIRHRLKGFSERKIGGSTAMSAV